MCDQCQPRQGLVWFVVPEVGVEDIVVGALNQRPKKSELSGWQNSTRKNFPDEVRKSFLRQIKCVNHIATKKYIK